MPLPLAPLLPIVLRLGALVGAAFAARRLIGARSYPGRTDERAEAALDDLGEGLTVHRPADRAPEGGSQTNRGLKVRRVIRWGKKAFEVEAAFLSRIRLRRLQD